MPPYNVRYLAVYQDTCADNLKSAVIKTDKYEPSFESHHGRYGQSLRSGSGTRTSQYILKTRAM